jgi:hypothetical protein
VFDKSRGGGPSSRCFEESVSYAISSSVEDGGERHCRQDRTRHQDPAHLFCDEDTFSETETNAAF